MRKIRLVGIGIALMLMSLAIGGGSVAADSSVTISRANMQKWAFEGPGEDHTGGIETGEFIAGPGTPPSGAGSTHFTLGNQAGADYLATTQFAGKALSTITALSFSTYVASDTVTTKSVALEFDIDYDPTLINCGSLTTSASCYQSRFVFVPGFNNSPQTVIANQWQTWDTMDSNNKDWYASIHGGSTGIPGHAGLCAQNTPCSWSDLKGAYPHAAVMQRSGPGQFGVKAGSGFSAFDGNMDNIVIGTSGTNTTYDFELGAGPAAFHVRPNGDDTLCNGQTNADLAANTAPDCAFKTIKHATDTAVAGDTINVHAGTYSEQVNVTKDLTLTGDGAGTTTIQVPAAPTSNIPAPAGLTGYSLVSLANNATATMSGVTLNGPWPFAGNCAADFNGIAVYGGSTLNLSATTVSNQINSDAASYGCQQGVGIQVGRNSIPQVGHATLSNVTVTGYQKNGITIDGAGTSATVDQSTVTGPGANTTLSQATATNGVQVSRGATGSVTNSHITNNVCDEAAGGCASDPVTGVQSAGILIFNSDGLTIQENTLTDNDIGVYNLSPSTAGNAINKAGGSTQKKTSAREPGPRTNLVAATPTQITGNTITNNRDENIFLDEGTATLSGNTITGSNIGVEAVSYGGEDGNAQGTLSQNEIKNATVAGIQLQLDPTATFQARVSGDSNSIHDNAIGVNNTTTNGTPLTMTNNFWGSANGPTNATNTFNVGSQGDSVSANVNFVPWRSTISGAPGSFTGTSFAPVTNTTPAGQFASIQAAVTAATGGTVSAAAGTFTEQVSITKDLTLTGAGAASTTIKAPGTPLVTDADGKKNIVEFRGGISNTMSGFTVSGPGPSTCGSIDTGIAALGGATLDLSTTNVATIRDNPFSGCQNGEGIRAGTPRNGAPAVGHLTVSNVQITDFQKNGLILAGSGSTGTISDVTITGAGATPTIAQNGIEIINGAVATVDHNTVSNIECNAGSCGPDPLSQVYATGISTTASGTGTIVQNNTVHDTDVGIDSDGSGKTITGNTLTNNRFEGIFLYQGNATLSGNTISGGRVGVELASFGPGNSQTGSADTTNAQGTLTNNTISGTIASIQLQDQDASDAFVPVVTGTGNKITGTVGVNNTTTSAANLANNWWGALTGPTNAANVGGTGSSITSNVAFTPWCGLADCSIHYGIGAKLVYTTQPVGGPATAPLATQPVLQAQDASGNLGINFVGPVALAFGANPGAATLGGTTTVNAVAGVATFTNVSVSKAGTGDTLVASSTGLTSATSNAFTVGAPIPTVSSMDVSTGTINGGTTVVITGTNFVTGDTVSFGGVAATNVQVLSGTQISVTTPAHAEGLVNVRVVNTSNQGNTLPQQYHYITSADVNVPTTRGGPIGPAGNNPAPAPPGRPIPAPNPHP
jgi:parallel beta-helix repeat protein